jgi:outer membrane protein TolC
MLVSKENCRAAAFAAFLVSCIVIAPCAALDYSSPSDYVGVAKPQGETAATGAAAPPAAGEVPAKQPEAGALNVTVPQAIQMALENNRSLVVQRMNPQLRRTLEEQQRAVFDPDFTADVSFARSRTRLPADAGGGRSHSQSISAQAGVQELLPTGTLLGLTGSTTFSQFAASQSLRYASSLDLSVDQHLLRGAGVDVNLVGLRQARIDIVSSQYLLRGFAEALVAQVEETYWLYALAGRQMDIFNQSLALAEQQLAETRERINVGKLAETEAVASEAEVALRREDLISGRNVLEKTRLLLLRLLNPVGGHPFEAEITLADAPTVTDVEPEPLSNYIDTAFKMRPDLNQARLQVNRGDLDVVKTKNGVLPLLDLFVTLGGTHYADSFGESVGSPDGRSFSASTGLSAEIPLFNRSARASHGRAVLSREQSLEAVDNLAQLVEVDVRSAYISITLAKETVAATAASSRLQAEKLRTETEKFRVGKSTSFLVAQAQRDLVVSQIAEVQAVTAYLNAFVELYRLDGSLLLLRGVSCPGAEPVKMTGEPSTSAPLPEGK